MTFKNFIVVISIFLAIIFDVVLGISKYPVLTLSVCVIVFLYEYVSPYIYSSR